MGSRNTPVDVIAGEEWRPVEGAEYYEVSSLGRVKRLAGSGRGLVQDRLLSPSLNTTGYWTLFLTYPDKLRSKKVHRLVAAAFIRSLEEGDVVNHLDGNKLNNALPNLEITTRAGNLEHAMANNLIRGGIRHGMAKLTSADVAEIRALFAAGTPGAAIAERFGISRNYAYQIKRGQERPKDEHTISSNREQGGAADQ